MPYGGSAPTPKLSPRLAELMAAESKFDKALCPASEGGERAYALAHARYAKVKRAIICFRARSAYDVLGKVEFFTYLKQPLALQYLEDRLVLAIRDDVQRLAVAAE